MSGRSRVTWRSKRPGRSRAGSSTSGRFVAAMTITGGVVSKPSISTSSWFRGGARREHHPADRKPGSGKSGPPAPPARGFAERGLAGGGGPEGRAPFGTAPPRGDDFLRLLQDPDAPRQFFFPLSTPRHIGKRDG